MSCYCLHYAVFGCLQKRRAAVLEKRAVKSCLVFVQRAKSQIPSVFFGGLAGFG